LAITGKDTMNNAVVRAISFSIFFTLIA